MIPVALYRMFDAEGRLLYIGQSRSPWMRAQQQAETRSTWATQIARIQVEWHPSRPEAMRAEVEAIRREAPLYNVAKFCRQAASRAAPPAKQMFEPAVLLQMENAAVSRGESVRGLLSEAGVNPSTWWRWKSGLSEPRMDTWRRVQSAFASVGASQ